MTDDAPNISGNYPNGGEKIGPAWADTWRALGREWARGSEIAESIAERHSLSPKTIMNLLGQAAKAGLIESERRFVGKVGGYRSGTNPIRPVWYRRAA